MSGNSRSSTRVDGSNTSTADPAGTRTYRGGSSEANAARTVFRATPSRREIALIAISSDRCNRRISAHSSTVITPSRTPRGVNIQSAPGGQSSHGIDTGDRRCVRRGRPARTAAALTVGLSDASPRHGKGRTPSVAPGSSVTHPVRDRRHARSDDNGAEHHKNACGRDDPHRLHADCPCRKHDGKNDGPHDEAVDVHVACEPATPHSNQATAAAGRAIVPLGFPGHEVERKDEDPQQKAALQPLFGRRQRHRPYRRDHRPTLSPARARLPVDPNVDRDYEKQEDHGTSHWSSMPPIVPPQGDGPRFR